MKKLIQRLLIFFIGLPVLIALVIFLPVCNHVCLNFLVILFTVLGALEFQNILKMRNLCISVPEAIILGGLIPALATASVSFNFSRLGIFSVFMAAASWLILSRIFSSKEQHHQFIPRTAAGILLMFYPGVFISWIIAINLLPQPNLAITIYFLMVFLNDSAAWAAGMLFGNGNRGFISASPNKSIAGFTVGIVTSILAGLSGVIFFPYAFVSRYTSAVPAGIFLGFMTGIAATLGDLGESVLKRSAGIKDSGVFIPGRGGILDSIDSLALAAPVFYLTYRLLFIS